MSTSLQQLQKEIVSWADDTFPGRTPQQGFLKLHEELGEVLREPRNPHEWADVFIMLFDLASHYGIDLTSAIHEKMAINRKRRWLVNEIGVMKHYIHKEQEKIWLPVNILDGPHAGSRLIDTIPSDGVPNELTLTTEEGVVFLYSLKHDFTIDEKYVYQMSGVID